VEARVVTATGFFARGVTILQCDISREGVRLDKDVCRAYCLQKSSVRVMYMHRLSVANIKRNINPCTQ
jgi:hypothetical protein